jgi:hypothetical protein
VEHRLDPLPAGITDDLAARLMVQIAYRRLACGAACDSIRWLREFGLVELELILVGVGGIVRVRHDEFSSALVGQQSDQGEMPAKVQYNGGPEESKPLPVRVFAAWVGFDSWN